MTRSAVIVVAALVGAAYILGQLLALGCSENLEPGTTRTDVCNSVGDLWAPSWWLSVLWPAALFLGSQLVPPLRRHPIAIAAGTGLLMVAFWTPLLLVVTDNLGS
jgi:hypothetical protein